MLTGRFVIFGGARFYPVGGMRDLLGRADTVDQAIKFAQTHERVLEVEPYSWWHVFDSMSGTIVAESDS